MTYGLDRRPTGIGRYALELLRALAKLPGRAEIVLLTTERDPSATAAFGFESHALPGCRRLPALLTVGNLVVSLAASRYRLDLVHDPNGIAPFLGPSGRARRVVMIHDACPRVCPDEHNRLDTWRYRALLPRAAENADLVLTNSAHSRQDLERYLDITSTRSRVIPGGVDERFRPIPAGDKRDEVLAGYGIRRPYLLYLGAVNGRKNIPRLLMAFAQVHPRHPGLTLVIAGSRQWGATPIDVTRRRLELGDRVHFPGYVDDADLPALYSGAEAFVFPSLYEGFGLPVLEAMACGTPTITSRTSSIPEVAGDAAILVDPLDVDAIAEAMERVLGDPEMASRLRARGLDRAGQFTWESAARKTLNAYQEVLDDDRVS